MPGDVSVHASAETRRYLATVPGRFEFVSAPRHGSWLNLVEGFFSRMARQMLRGIRVSSKDELKERILRHLGGRAPSRSPAGGGGTCRTQARQPRSSSWTLFSRMRWARQISFWTPH